MKLHISNSQVSVIGKIKETAKIQSAISAMISRLDTDGFMTEDTDEEKYIEIGFGYDMDAHTVDDVKRVWVSVKEGL